MAGKIVIDSQRCKGCGLFVEACPNGCIKMSTSSNEKGYSYAQLTDGTCSGCGMCAIMCSEAVIEVYRDDSKDIVDLGPKKKTQKTRFRRIGPLITHRNQLFFSVLPGENSETFVLRQFALGLHYSTTTTGGQIYFLRYI